MSEIVRSFAPKVDQVKCIGCGQCVQFCPEGTIILDSNKKLFFDYRYCKGCGVCANECAVDAIEMVKEGEQ